MKKILIIIPVIVIVIIAGIYFSLSTIIKRGVETIGPQATGTDIRLSSVRLSPFSGKGQIKGLFIGNPKGFQSESAFKLNEIRLALDVRSLFSEKILIDEIYIDAPDITYETSGKSDNIRTILNNVKAYAGGSRGTAKKDKADKPGGGDKEAEKKVEIHDVVVKNGKVTMSVTALKGEQLSMDMPDIHLTDIGRKGKDATVSEAMEQIFSAMSKNVNISVEDSVQVIRKRVEQEVEKAVGSTVDESVGKLKGFFGK